MVGKKGNTLLSEITKTEKTTEKRQPEKWAAEIGQPENSATKNDSVDKRETQSYIVSRRDSNSCLGNRKNGRRKMGIYLRHAVTRMTQLQAYVIRVRLKTTGRLSE